VQPVSVAEDRSAIVPQGKLIRTGYVPVFTIELACRDRISPADIDKAMQRRMACAPDQPFPCPLGTWDSERQVFRITDGRHEWLAAICLGVEHMLVAWIDEA
jgi:hypothetical protein